MKEVILILSVAAVVTYGYLHDNNRQKLGPRLELHDEILSGTASAPYRYRVLVPFAVEGLVQLLSTRLTRAHAFGLAYDIYDLLAVFFLLGMLFWWSRTWFTAPQALTGVLFVAATMPIALKDHYFQPWSLLESGLFSAALLAMHRQHYSVLLGIMAAATLNKETAIFIVLAFLLTLDGPSRFKAWRHSSSMSIACLGGLFLVWLSIHAGLRYALGHGSLLSRVPGLIARNLAEDSLVRTGINASLFLGGFWVFAAMGLRDAPRFIRRVALIIPFYLAAVLIWGVWYEVRLLMPLYPVLVPLGLSFLYLRDGRPVGN
jgi:hypothetical protein